MVLRRMADGVDTMTDLDAKVRELADDILQRAVWQPLCSREDAVVEKLREAMRLQRERDADYVKGCREDDHLSPRVQVFDVLASAIRAQEAGR